MSNKKVHFRFSTNILARLGEELNPSPSQGLIELVKNSYDADAKTCIVELINVHTPNGKIVISDTGVGMDESEIIEGWLILGKSIKVEDPITTELGRVKTGNKGLGRLAAIRLGKKVILSSIKKNNSSFQNKLEIDWEEFEKIAIVEDVPLIVEKIKNDTSKRRGTSITLENLKISLNKNEVKKLARAMILLADPFGDNLKGFKPILKTPEFEDLEKLVETKYFQDAEFHLIATVENGVIKAKVLDWKNENIFVANHEEIAKNRPKYNCPNSNFELWVYVLNKETFASRLTTITEVQDWLSIFGGVHLYYNDIRVSPYGDSGNDWLDMNLMRVRSPELRPSTNTSMGKITVFDLENQLIQKTDRSGFIENEAFAELRYFAQDVLNWMAKKRLEERENKRTAEKSEAESKSESTKKDFEEVINNIPTPHKEILINSFSNYDKFKDRLINSLRKEVQLYRTLSTVGIASAVFAHESGNNPLKIISQSIGTVNRRILKFAQKYYEEQFKQPITRIKESIKSLSVLSKVSLSLVEYEKRRSGRINIHETIENIVDLYKPFSDNREVEIEYDFDSGIPFMRGSIAALESILTNLLNNSYNAFERANIKDRKILIRTRLNHESLEIRVLDNGPGIMEISKKDIWLPGETTRKNGTGLGLTIVRDTVLDLGGRVDAIEHSEMGGAEIIITLKILGA